MEITEEEKIFGGVLSVRQVVYLLAGAIPAVSVFLMLHFAPLFLRVLAAVIPAAAGPVLAFGEVRGMKMDRYIVNLALFLKRRRKFLLYGGTCVAEKG
jgi:hypothetical protein